MYVCKFSFNQKDVNYCVMCSLLFYQVAFSIKGLSRKEIKKLHLKHSMYIKSVTKAHIHDDQNGGGLRVSMSRSFSGPIILQSLHSSVLTPDMVSTGAFSIQWYSE